MTNNHWIKAACLLAILPACLTYAASPPADKSAIKAALAERLAQVEKQIAQRMMRQAQTAPDRLPRLELEIDMRIVWRWLLAKAEGAKPSSDAQITTCLRADLWLDSTAALEAAFSRTDTLTVAQTDGMARLHKLTFNLPDAKSVGELDQISRQLGILLLLLSNPGPEAQQVPPQMRPTPINPADNSAATPTPIATTQRTDVQMAEEVARLRVSPALRQQLIAVVSVLVAPANGSAADPAACRKILEIALELAGGLNANIGVSPESRVEMEAQLAEGLALFMDPRTRAAGQTKVSALQQYRIMLAAIQRLKLTPEQTAQFLPVFTFARQNPEPGARAIAMLEQYARHRAQFEARTRPPLGTSQAMRKNLDELAKQLTQASTAFCTAAAAANVKDMEQHMESMRRVGDVLSKLDQIPATIDALAPFKPKQFGNLDRRVTTVATIIVTNGKQQAEAAKYLDDLHQLGKTASELGQLTTKDIPPQIDRAYAGGKLSLLDAKWKGLITELASAAASANGEIDSAKMARLPAVRTLYDALKQAAALEAALADTESLRGWIDWRMTPADLRAVLAPQAAALSEAIAAFIGADSSALFAIESPGALEQWPKVEARYRPLTALIIRSAAYREQCRALPNGFIGLAASLMTPLEGAPFGPERQASFAIGLWKFRTAMGDTAAAAEVLATLLK